MLRRRVPIEAETIGLLRAHAGAMTREQHGSKYVFVTARGAWLRGTINRSILAPICARAAEDHAIWAAPVGHLALRGGRGQH